MGKKVQGTDARFGAFYFETDAPLDDRSVIDGKRSLMELDTWGAISNVYKGLLTVDLQTQDVYICTKKHTDATAAEKAMFIAKGDTSKITDLDKRISTWWTKLPSQTDLKNALETNKKDLFTFKGVATGIDADHCIITVGYAEGSDGNNYTIEGTAYDILKEEMYGWGTESGKPTYWTHETSGVLSPIYIRGDQQNIQGLSYNGVTYYFSSTNVYQSLNGDFLYKNAGKYYTDSGFSKEVTGVTDEHYHGYEFTEVEGFTLTLKNPDDGGKTANSTSIGHVYQIGEEEYASNGSIWVQLGSPKEDWIVIK